ncbi:DUF4159 domain-containing protein [Planctomycetales bacterium ZRK34]|nr:DUF4159 domain-containing protein [Planctomycetales bacterium ZRK34]
MTDEQVRQTIDQLVAYLYKTQNDQGHWDRKAPEDTGHHNFGMQYGGMSALATYALLASGQSYQHPQVARAIRALKSFPVRGTYVCALRIHVWNQLPDSFQDEMRKDLGFLLTCLKQSTIPGKAKAFSYGPGVEGWSNSRTQYGLLGLWEAAKRGYPIPNEAWEGLQRHFEGTQLTDGSWPYRASGDPEGTVAMTAAGLTAMYIFRDFHHAQAFQSPGKLLDYPIQTRINNGITYFEKHWQPDRDKPGRDKSFLGYHLYGTERVGLASGRKYFGGKDWFKAGAQVIIMMTTPEHGFATPGASAYSKGVVDSSFALLFLTRGRVPVFMNKLELPGAHWNNRPADVAHLARWVSDTVEQEMNWQVLPITAEPEVWLEAPILYLAGHEAVELTPEQEAKVKRYIDLGGLLVTTADRGDRRFTESIQAMMKRLYPLYDYAPIDSDDELANVVFPIGPSRIGATTLHNGVRHLAVHLGRGDASWVFQSDAHTDPTPWQFMVNAYYYATEKGHARLRLAEHFVPKLRRKGDALGQVTVTRAQYNGNWNPEPAAWEVQSNVMHNAGIAGVNVNTTDLASIGSTDAGLVHVVGTDAVTLTDAQLQAIRKHVDRGGIILFENAGGRGVFTESIVDALHQIYPQQRLRPISLKSPIITGQDIGGIDTSTVHYRVYTLLRMGDITMPRLLSFNFDGEPRIIISSEDLSAGMLGQPIWGVFGYSTESAQALITNLTMLANQRR